MKKNQSAKETTPPQASPRGEKPLNDKQMAFAREYAVDFNGKQAAIRAGYSKKTAKVIAARLLTKVNLQAEIRRRLTRAEKEAQVKAVDVLEGFKRVAFADLRELFNDDGSMKEVKDMDPAIMLAIASIEIVENRDKDGNVTGYTKKVRLNDRVRALIALAEHHGLFKDSIPATQTLELHYHDHTKLDEIHRMGRFKELQHVQVVDDAQR